MSRRQEFEITPIAKPRMTQRDKWAKRDCVMRYWAFCDEVRLKGVVLPVSGATVTFVLPMPVSWSKKRKSKYDGKPHKSKPDWDNLGKALSDAIYEDDSCVWDIRIIKIWGIKGGIIIEGTV